MKIDFKVAFLVLVASSHLACVDAWWSKPTRPSVRRPPPPQRRCALQYYKGSEFTKSARVHTGFLSSMHTINSYAQQCRVRVYITSSYRKTAHVKGAIVPPATRSNHMIGHAIDMNLIDRRTGKFCNSRCLPNSSRPNGVSCFIGKIRSHPTLRWGGDFRRSDPVHIDDATNHRNRALWNQLYNSLQKNCPWLEGQI